MEERTLETCLDDHFGPQKMYLLNKEFYEVLAFSIRLNILIFSFVVKNIGEKDYLIRDLCNMGLQVLLLT